MGNSSTNTFGIHFEEFKDPNNITVIVEKEKHSNISPEAEGTYIIPNTTNCVKIADLIFSLIKTPIVLYLCGQDYTHNYTPLKMLSGLMEEDCLHLVYAERSEFGRDSVMIEEYVKGVEVKWEGPLRIVLRPDRDKAGKVFRVQPWGKCSMKQLGLILSRISGVEGVRVLLREGFADDRLVESLRDLVQLDGLVHLKYTY